MDRKKQWSLLLSIVLLLTAVAGGTVAFLAVKTASVENQFESAYVTCKVIVGEEDITDVFRVVNSADEKNVKVQNTSNVDAYIRAAIIVNWMDEEGNVRGIAPVEKIGDAAGDYTLFINDIKWKKDTATGFYYYTDKVASYDESSNDNDTTANLINNISVTSNPPAGYTLTVEVIAEAIQADGVTDDTKTPAVQDAWFNPLTEETRAILNAWGIAPSGN